ncbi:MAG: hypothetical protein A2020_13365 [Lentisphaerae bacterium GWF2_45_14]|nr:MAG: hypothetical protein A2020_13365 [Lentisphaerae bacterium GWF2_45_14]
MAEHLVNSIKKALDTLDILIFSDPERKGISLAELSRRTDIRPNTLHNILKTMLRCGYVAQQPDSSYAAGPKCAAIGSENKFRKFSELYLKNVLEKLHSETDESTVFYTLRNGGRVPILSFSGGSAITIDQSQMDSADFFSKATGRILASFGLNEELDEILELNGLPGKSWNDIDSREKLSAAIAEIKKSGYIIIHENNGIISIAVPVLDAAGRLVGALGCYAPAFRCPEEKHTKIIQALFNSATNIRNYLS